MRKDQTKDATIKRNPENGRLVSVTTSNGVSRASGISGKVVEKASEKHSDALKRLVNR